MKAVVVHLALLGLLAFTSTAYGRSLLQASNTNCPQGCATVEGACIADPSALNQVRCRQCDATSNRIPAVDGTCGCRRGQYLVSDSSVTNGGFKCVPCPKGSFCPGGTEDQSTDSTTKGKRPCGTGLTTVNTGAGSATHCVTSAGYFYVPASGSSANNMPSATPCPQHTYNVGNNKLKACTPCKAGLRTTDFGDTTNGLQSTSSAACKVPSGWYSVSGGKVVRCPRGQFRNGLASVGTSSAKCDRCATGTTTKAAASKQESDCKVLLAGYQWTSTTPYTSGRKLQQSSNTPTSVAKLCPWKWYCPGDSLNADSTAQLYLDAGNNGATQCPKDLWTRQPGARSEADCVVPPGHKFLPAATGTKVVMCDTSAGEYRTGWTTVTDPATTTTNINCNTCGGSGSSLILSDTTEPVNTFSADTSDPSSPVIISAPVTASSCYISQGEGMVYANAATQTFRKVICNNNNYGVATTRQWGLALTPCQDCPKGTVTNDNSEKATTNGGFFAPTSCKTPAGYGFDGVQATPCAKGLWNDGSADPADICKPCPTGTTTEDATTSLVAPGVSLLSCKIVLPGYGYTAGTGTTSDDKLKNILETPSKIFACPLGQYQPDEANITPAQNKDCTTCDYGLTTRETGATRQTQCDVCPAGQGQTAGDATSTCTSCSSGKYGSADRAAGTPSTCQDCPTANTNTFNFIYNGDQNTYTPSPVTAGGATSPNQCMLGFAAIEDGNWWMANSVSSPTESTQTSFMDCVNQCTSASACAYVTYNYSTKKCTLRTVSENTPTGINFRIAYKVVPNSNLEVSRRASTPQAQGSGFWSWWADANTNQVGTNLSGQTYQGTGTGAKTVTECLEFCNDLSTCAGVKFEFNSSPALNNMKTCTLFSGTVTPMGVQRTMIRTRLDPITGVVPA